MDFFGIVEERGANGKIKVAPDFYPVTENGEDVTDVMIKGGGFYAVWLPDENRWSTKQSDVFKLVDGAMKKYVSDNIDRLSASGYSVKLMRSASSGSVDKWNKYCKQQMWDNYVQLDQKITFQNQETTKESYASKRLKYALKEGPMDSYNTLMNVLYSEKEKHKLEFAVGSVISGDSVRNQKFYVLYGEQGTGKGTWLGILQMLFDGYCKAFRAKDLGSGTNPFPLEALKDDPLVAIDPDGDLSHLDDNTTLNALTAHEIIPVNTKYGKIYPSRFHSLLFIGSNKPVNITDGKSGLLRRLIDVSPTGNKVSPTDYRRLMKGIEFELGAIAKHCLDVYKADPHYYDKYKPLSMMEATNDFYNYIVHYYFQFKNDNQVSITDAWESYKDYNEKFGVIKPYGYRQFREELKNYFEEYVDRAPDGKGGRIRSVCRGFKADKVDGHDIEVAVNTKEYVIDFKEQPSIIDDILKDCPAQEAIGDPPKPKVKWTNCKTTLKDIDTHKLHYILPVGHEDLIRIDFDFTNEKGEKDPDLNLKEANKWPRTYAERSKSGAGVHLYYIYTGDPSKLSNVYDEHIEIKTNVGNSSIRRKLTVCNDIPVSKISSGLPLKGDDKKVYDEQSVLTNKGLVTLIKRALNKEHHGYTAPEIDLIKDALDKKYASGEKYDVTAFKDAVISFASQSHHQAKECQKKVSQMHFSSDDNEVDKLFEQAIPKEAAKVDILKPIAIFDIEVVPDLFLVCWKLLGKDRPVHALFNPSAEEIKLLHDTYRLVGFNCRRYDNHIMVGRMQGYDNNDIFNQSQSIINRGKGFISTAYDFSYTDIYDYSSLKQSLKKWEIMLGIHHQENNFPWDKPIGKENWPKMASYCKNDVLATEAVWEATQSDFLAREILADLTGLSVNDTTNTLTARLIFGSDKTPQSVFNYRDLSQPVTKDENGNDLPDEALTFRAWNGVKSAVPFFPGYKFENGKSYYRGEEIGEGGKVYAEPGIYYDVPVLDITSMHPSSIIAENLFGPYTAVFAELVKARVLIKHAVAAMKNGDDSAYARNIYDAAKLPNIGAKLEKYLADPEKLAGLPQALKIAINSVYGLTAASFTNPFRDPRNKDNIVAKRGALFMTDLKFAVQERGFTVAHIKTDSIKIPQATLTIREFVENFGKMYGYSFEVEDDYEKICLVNDAVYIAKEKNGGWTATGAQFQVPYVFKKLFSKEKITLDDLCETKAVSTSLYLDFNEDCKDEHNYIFVGKVGRFCPVKDGFGGGELLREKDGKYYSVTGTKKPDGKSKYRWKEAEIVEEKGLDNEIDISYYDRLCEEAVQAVNKAGEKKGIDYQTFVSNDIPVDLPF